MKRHHRNGAEGTTSLLARWKFGRASFSTKREAEVFVNPTAEPRERPRSVLPQFEEFFLVLVVDVGWKFDLGKTAVNQEPITLETGWLCEVSMGAC